VKGQRKSAAVNLADTLRSSREAMGLTLRGVEQLTAGRIKNAYLSQVETGQIHRPSPEVLWLLSDLYGLDYDSLLISAGHRSGPQRPIDPRSLAGIPLRAFDGLSQDQRRQVASFVGFLRQQSASSRATTSARAPKRRPGRRGWDSNP
jgi:HTH-type transcriptional regulator, competence development regulator